jgi:predicted CDP-diglyceride synthetase/phosphatidate cytidylyltransferase
MFSKLIQHIWPNVVRPLHALWNEVIGFLFLIFAVVAAFYVFRAVRDFSGDVEGLFRIAMPGMFGLLMGYFGISSFLKARKISRS